MIGSYDEDYDEESDEESAEEEIEGTDDDCEVVDVKDVDKEGFVIN